MNLFEIDYIDSTGGCFIFECRASCMLEAVADAFRCGDAKIISNVKIKQIILD